MIEPHVCTGYAVFWRCLPNKDGYVQVLRWNGAVRDFTVLGVHVGPEYGVADGDLIEASIVGNVIAGRVMASRSSRSPTTSSRRGALASGSTSVQATRTSITG